MRTIEYRKLMLSGPLTGITVGGRVTVPSRTAGGYQLATPRAYRPGYEGRDPLTGDRYRVTASRSSVPDNGRRDCPHPAEAEARRWGEP